jgi:hypothetical protein
VPGSWSDFCSNVSNLKLTCDPIHGESVVGYVFSNIMIPSLNVSSVFCIFIAGSHGNSALTVKENSSG